VGRERYRERGLCGWWGQGRRKGEVRVEAHADRLVRNGEVANRGKKITIIGVGGCRGDVIDEGVVKTKGRCGPPLGEPEAISSQVGRFPGGESRTSKNPRVKRKKKTVFFVLFRPPAPPGRGCKPQIRQQNPKHPWAGPLKLVRASARLLYEKKNPLVFAP